MQGDEVWQDGRPGGVADLPSHMAALLSISLEVSQTPAYAARPRIWASASRHVPVYATAFAGTHWAYPQRDGQDELKGWLVTH